MGQIGFLIVPGIGHRLDGYANTTLDPGAIVALSPAITAAQRAGYTSWGPGRYDPRYNIDGLNTPIVLPPAYGLANVDGETYTAEGPVSYWNAYVAVTQMHGHGSFSDSRLGIAITQSPGATLTVGALNADAGSVSLTAANSVATLSGRATQAAGFSFGNTTALSVGTVDGIAGVGHAGGAAPVTLATASGGISQTQRIATSSLTVSDSGGGSIVLADPANSFTSATATTVAGTLMSTRASSAFTTSNGSEVSVALRSANSTPRVSSSSAVVNVQSKVAIPPANPVDAQDAGPASSLNRNLAGS
jgi:hypothetical protein